MTDARESMESYLGRLNAALSKVREREREELLAEVRTHLEDVVLRASDPDAEIQAAVKSLGDPRVLAERLRGGEPDEPAPERVKRILGIPYDFSMPTAEKIASRLWNPSDPRILMPRVFGAGWDVNFGAVAVRLGLVRPDDEEPMPFSGVPDAALAVGLAAVTLAVLASVVGAVVFRDVPRPVPVHWGIAGPDRFGSQITAALWFLGPLVALNALALWRFFRGSAARTERALWIAGLAFAIAVLAGSYAGAIAWALTGHQPFPSGVPVLVGLVLLFAVLAGYSRLGLAAEWRQARVR